jgi:hypothetical protein
VTFKDLRKIIAEKNKETERESKLYNPSYYWKGRKIVSLDQWFQIKENYTLKAALQYFPNDFPSFGFSYSSSFLIIDYFHCKFEDSLHKVFA